MTIPTFSAAEALHLAVRSCCIARAISLLETIAAREEMGPGGMFHGQVTRLITSVWLERLATAIPRWVFGVLLVIDSAAVVTLFVWPENPILLVAAMVLFLLEMKRHYLSFDGADQMVLVVLTAAALGVIGNADRSAVLFLAGEVSLAYLVGGLYKVSSPYWKRGKAVLLVTQTRLYGHAGCAAWLRSHPEFANVSQFVFVLWESSFFISLIAPPQILAMLLLAGVMFHVSCAYIMGLNTFPWAFVASYPSVVFVNGYSRSLLAPSHDIYLAVTLALIVASVVAGGGAFVSHRGARRTRTVRTLRMPEPAD